MTDYRKYRTGKRRLVAAFVDSLLVFLPTAMILSNYGWENASNLPSILLYLLSFFPIIYSVGMNYLFGQTGGKMLMNIKIVDAYTESKISLKQHY